MAVDPGAAVTGDMLDDGQHAALEQPLADRSAEPRDAPRLGAICSVADHRVGAGHRKIEHRQAIDVMPRWSEIVGDQPRAETGRRLGLNGSGNDPRRAADG